MSCCLRVHHRRQYKIHNWENCLHFPLIASLLAHEHCGISQMESMICMLHTRRCKATASGKESGDEEADLRGRQKAYSSHAAHTCSKSAFSSWPRCTSLTGYIASRHCNAIGSACTHGSTSAADCIIYDTSFQRFHFDVRIKPA